MTTLLRRCCTIPGYAVAFTILACCFPVLIAATLLIDTWRGDHSAFTRTLLLALAYLLCELAGILAATLFWLVRGWWAGKQDPTYLRWNFRLQCLWGRSLARIGFWIYGIRLEVENDFEPPATPFLLLVRHSSIADTILAVLLVSDVHDIPLRYVLKSELLYDPCLDLVGNRLPNCFVERGSSGSRSEISRVGALARGLAGAEGVLIYPEGTRFTPEKKKRIMERLEAGGDSDGLALASSLQTMLPPRPGGVMALLDAAPEADIVFLHHYGLEGSGNLRGLLDGALSNRTVRASFRHVPRSEVPADGGERLAWLRREWLRMDRFVREKIREDG